MTYKTIVYILAFLISSAVHAQSWKWGKLGGGTGADLATDLALDVLDNMYACGTYTSQATFDGQTISGSGINSFIIKYDSSGTLKWVFSFPGTIKKVSIDPNNSNNIVFSGIFSGSITIGPTSLTSNGAVDCFAFKVDSLGTIVWATSWGGNNDDDLSDLEYQVNNEIIATGTFNSSTILFKDGVSLNQTYNATLTNSKKAANLYLFKLKSTDGKAVNAYTKGVSTDPYTVNLTFEADMRGHAGISIQKGDFSQSGFGVIIPPPIVYGNTTIQKPYVVLQLDTTLQIRKILLTDSSYQNNYDRFTIQRTSTHLDKNSVYYLHKALDYLDVGGIFIGERGHIEYVTPYNILNEVTFGGAGFSTGTCCDAPPMLTPFGIYDNKLAYRLGNGPTGVQAFSLKFSTSLSKAHSAAFNASTHLVNDAVSKVYIAGSYSGGSNTLDGISFQGLGNTDAYFAVLQLPLKPLQADAGVDRVKCSGSNGVYLGGSPTASGGNNSPYNYSWTPTISLNNPATPYPLANPAVTTTYYLTVANSLGQIANDTVIVYVNETIPASITPAGTVTVCGSQTVQLTANRGTSYLWSNGDTARSIGGYFNLAAGVYTVTVKDECGVASVSPAVSIVRNPVPPTPTITANGPTTFCNGGSVTLTAPGGYTYLWSNGATTQSIVATLNGRYSVTVFNSFGCNNQSFSTHVIVNPTTTDALSITASGPTTFCEGNSIQLRAPTGITGNPTAFTYLWSTGSTNSLITVNTSGTYSVTISSPNGCGSPQTLTPVVVNVLPRPPTPLITASGPTTFCGPGQVTLTAPPGYPRYVWLGAFITDTLGQSQSITIDSTTVAVLQVFNPNGCPSNTAAVYVYESTPITGPVNITTSGQLTICEGDTSPRLTAPGGSGYSYLWSDGSTSQSIFPAVSGSYTVTVSNGCNAVTSSPVVVTVNPRPPAIITTSGPTTFCDGGSVTLTAPSGPGYTYQWYWNGFINPLGTSQSIVATFSSTYTVRIRNSFNCTRSIQTIVTVNSNPFIPTITAGGPATFCQGGSVTLTTPTVAGYTYLWSNGSTTASTNATTSGSYTVTVTNASGCSRTSNAFAVTVVPPPSIPVIISSGPTNFCIGGSVTLSAPPGLNWLWSTGATTQSINVNTSGNFTVTVTNGTGCSSTSIPTVVTVNPLPSIPVITASGPTSFCVGGSVSLSAPAGFSYLWSNGSISQTINVNTSGNFSVTVTNANGCSSTSSSTTVTVNPLPATPVITASGPTSFCQGSFITLTAPAGFSYLWNTGVSTQSIPATSTGNYSVTITNANGCSASSAATTVTVHPTPPLPVVSASGPTTFCQGGSLTLTAPAGYTYLWSNGLTTQAINVTTSGNYSVTVTNANNCNTSSAITGVLVNPSPAIPVVTTNGPTTFCQGGSVTLTAPAGFSYLWSNGATTQTINVNNSGNFTVAVTNASGCSSTSAATNVTVNPLPAAPVITQAGNVLTSPAASTYQWYFNGAIIPGATSQTYTYNTGGDYTVTVTNAAGCSATSVTYTAMRNEFVLLGDNERFYFSLFPNPVTTQLSIQYQIEQSHNVSIRLINMNGRSITIQNPVMRAPGAYTVNANAVAERIWTGMYILEFTIDNKKATRTIIKF